MAMAMAIRREKKIAKKLLSKKTLVVLVTWRPGTSEFFQVKFITLKMEVCCSFKALVGGTTLRMRGTSYQTCLDTT